MSRLHWGARRGLIEEVRAGLEEGLDPNEAIEPGRTTPLYLACEQGYLAIVRLLLECGADPNQKIRNRFTPLCGAMTSTISDARKIEIICLFAELKVPVDWSEVAVSIAMNPSESVWNAAIMAGADANELCSGTVITAKEMMGKGGYRKSIGEDSKRRFSTKFEDASNFIDSAMATEPDPELYFLQHYKVMLFIGFDTTSWPDGPEKRFIDRLQQLLWSIDEKEALFRSRLSGDELVEAEKHVARLRRRERKYLRRSNGQ